ncbi:MAG: hypothetical protein II126_05495 [Erysipelotrichaceae bacterium]|nr:hypothetical protein [Erysipelotrichaceae bacterium]
MGKAPVKRITAVRKFTDRDEPRAAFNRIFEDALGHVDEFNVISYYGIGGFGKTRLYIDTAFELAVTGARSGKHKQVLPPLRKIMDYSDDYIKPEELTSLSEMQKKAQLYGRLEEFIRRELNMFADVISMLDKLKEDKLRDFFTDIYHKRKEFLKQFIE